MLNFDPQTTHEPLKRSSPNLACVITSWIPPNKKKIGVNPLRGFFSPLTPHTRNIHPNVRYATHVYYFLWFFQSPTAETPAWILTLNTSNVAVLRMDDPFDSYKSEFSYLTEFWSKFEKINIVSKGKS